MQSFTFKSILVTCFLCFIFNTTTSAQRNLEITVITKNNDSIKGLIPAKNRFKFYKSLTIKAKTDNALQVYYPKDIQSFTIKTDDQLLYFKTLIIEADYSADDLTNLSDSPKIELTKDIVFAQLLLKGKKSTYYYVDNVVFKDHYVIETEEGKAIDLVNKRYYVDAYKTTTSFNPEYKNQLMRLLASPAVPAERIVAAPFKKKDIVKLVKGYNSTKPEYEYKTEKAKVKFGISAGMNMTSLTIKGSFYNGSQLKFNKSYGFNAGIGMNLILPQTQKRWSFYNELMYSNYKVSLQKPYVFYQTSNEYKHLTELSITASYAKLFTAFRYQSKQQFAPFFQFGIVNGYAFKNSTRAHYESYFYTINSSESGEWMDFRKYEQSLFVGAGLTYKKTGWELRYEAGNGFSKMTELNSRFNSAYILFTYTF